MNIKQLSNELGVSEQALRSWCKRNGVRKESESETKGKKAGYILTENNIEQIKTYYATKGKQEKETKKGNESKTLDILAEQLREKDKQLSERDKQINNLLEQLKAKEQQVQQLNDKLTTALGTAQALHAGTIQTLQDKQEPQAQTETTAAAAADLTAEQAQIDKLTKQVQELKAEKEKTEQAQEQLTARVKELETAAAQEPHKLSIFQRLFKRKK